MELHRGPPAVAPAGMALGLTIAVIYGAVAVAANFVNKFAMMILPLPNSVLLLQTVTMLAITRALHVVGVVHVPPLTASRLRQLLPLSLAYTVHASLVLRSLISLNIPMYNTLKRLTPVMVLVAKACMDRRLPDGQIAASVVLIVAGCVVAGAGDLAFDAYGYAMALTCALCQALYILLAEQAGGGEGRSAGGGPHRSPSRGDLEGVGHGHSHEHADEDGATGHAPRRGRGHGHGGVGPAEILHTVAVVGTPLLLLMSLLSGEGARVLPLVGEQLAVMGPVAFMLWLALIAVIEGLLTGCVVLCSQVNSALTTSVVGVLKGIVAVFLGFFLLGGVKFHPLNVLGISLNVLGGVWYTVSKYRQSVAGKVANMHKDGSMAPLLGRGVGDGVPLRT